MKRFHVRLTPPDWSDVIIRDAYLTVLEIGVYLDRGYSVVLLD